MKAVIALGGQDGSEFGLLFGGKKHCIAFECGDIDDFARLTAQLSGLKSTRQIADVTGLSLREVEDNVQKLVQAGLVYEYCQRNTADSADVQSIVQASRLLFSSLRYDFARHPLFAQALLDEKLFLGTAYEYFFLVNDASTHISMAIDNAPESVRPILQRYLADEKDHGKDIAPSLASAVGISVAQLDECIPCAAAEAAILKMCELARTDTLSYVAAAEFCEASANRPLRLDALSNQWSVNSNQLLGALAHHHSQDVDAGHGSIFEEAIRHWTVCIDNAHAGKCLASAHEFKHYLDNLNHEILRMYGVEGASLPRARPSFEDFRN